MKNQTRIIQVIIFALLLAFASQAQVVLLQPLTTFGPNGDGSLRPNDVPGLVSTNQLERGLAYNPTTGHLLVVDRSTYSGVNNDVHIIDGNTGAYIGTLTGIVPLAGGTSNFVQNLIGVADDGAIYVANLTSGATGPPQTRLYRWASEADTAPALISPTGSFPADDPSSGTTVASQKRWGDTMTVRCSGLGTQILLA